jgi:hypothetical protein
MYIPVELLEAYDNVSSDDIRIRISDIRREIYSYRKHVIPFNRKIHDCEESICYLKRILIMRKNCESGRIVD